jgi:3-oxoacyl-[acyl-carrier-protein] synthase III
MKMIWKSAGIGARDYVLPPLYMTSEEIESQLSSLYERCKLPQGRLALQTGIERRGYWPLETAPSEIAQDVGEKVLAQFEREGGKREEIDLLIYSSVCRDFLEPATAAKVHQLLGLSPQCQIFDLSNACLGMLSATTLAAQMVESGSHRLALIVSAENSAPLLFKTLERFQTQTHYNRQTLKPEFASLTIGSAGVAWMVSTPSVLTHRSLLKLDRATTLTDSSAADLCRGQGTREGLQMFTESEKLLEFGLELAKKNWDRLEADLSILKVIPHQVGQHHRRLMLQRLSLGSHVQDFSTVEQFGNTGSAALPLTFLVHEKEHQAFSRAEKLAFLGIGSGLTSTMLQVQMP